MINIIDCQEIGITGHDLCFQGSFDPQDDEEREVFNAGMKYKGQSKSLLTGTILGNPDSSVIMSIHDGITEIMIRVGDALHSLECDQATGEVRDNRLPNDGSIILDGPIELTNPEEGGTLTYPLDPLPPNGFKLRVHVFYDQAFMDRFGSAVDERIDAVFAFVNGHFRLPSLTTIVEPILVDRSAIPDRYWRAQDSIELSKYCYPCFYDN